jgi:cephalosporin-C deacetylase-like acetyl esterase
MDKNRLGVYGGSYGGFITLMALCTSLGTYNRDYSLGFLLEVRIAANTGTFQQVQGRLYRFLMLSASAE